MGQRSSRHVMTSFSSNKMGGGHGVGEKVNFSDDSLKFFHFTLHVCVQFLQLRFKILKIKPKLLCPKN